MICSLRVHTADLNTNQEEMLSAYYARLINTSTRVHWRGPCHSSNEYFLTLVIAAASLNGTQGNALVTNHLPKS